MLRLLTHQYYDNCVRAVLKMRDQNKQMAFTLGHIIKKMTYLKLSARIKLQDEERKKESREFLDLYNSSWSEEVRMQQMGKINKPVLLPTIDALYKLNKFSDSEITKEMQKYLERFQYIRLQKLILASLILFNNGAHYGRRLSVVLS